MASTQEPQTQPQADWHAMAEQQVLQDVGSGEQGLKSLEVPHRLEQFGRNALEDRKSVV